MWFVTRTRYEVLKTKFEHALASVTSHQTAIEALETTIKKHEAATAALHHELRLVRDDLAVARMDTATAKAYMDTWRLRINQLERERAEFMVRAFPGVEIPVPQVGRSDQPAENEMLFHDMGDAAASMQGLADTVPLTTAVGDGANFRPPHGTVAAAPLAPGTGMDVFKDVNEE